MSGYIKGHSRNQTTLFPEMLDDFVDENNPVRAIDVFVDELDLKELGFSGTGRSDNQASLPHPNGRDQIHSACSKLLRTWLKTKALKRINDYFLGHFIDRLGIFISFSV